MCHATCKSVGLPFVRTLPSDIPYPPLTTRPTSLLFSAPGSIHSFSSRVTHAGSDKKPRARVVLITPRGHDKRQNLLSSWCCCSERGREARHHAFLPSRNQSQHHRRVRKLHTRNSNQRIERKGLTQTRERTDPARSHHPMFMVIVLSSRLAIGDCMSCVSC